MNNGLRCSHGSLYFTSVILGKGKQIPTLEQQMLKKWPHKESKIIVIVSLPLQYKILDGVDIGIYNKGDAAYYYTPSKDNRERYSLTDYPYVMPEFIVGYYDSRTDSFAKNTKYYEKLSQIAPALLDRQMTLPSGEKIIAKQYIKEIVLHYLSTNGFVYLNNGASIPILHFIIECVIFDCQKRYNGDFARYMKENVRNIEITPSNKIR